MRDAVLDVRAVKAADVVAGVSQRKTLDDLGASAGVGGRGERDAGHVREPLLEQVELQVVGSKIVPPLRDAVGLVNGEQRDSDLLKQREGAFLGEALRGNVEQVQLPGPQRLLDPPGSISLQGGVQVAGPHAQLRQGGYLVLHQGDQRRNDDPHTGAHQGRKLIAQGFAAAGRHQHQRVAPGDQLINDLPLRAAKVVVAERLPE